MKDVGKNQPLAAGAASLWLAVASQAHTQPGARSAGQRQKHHHTIHHQLNPTPSPHLNTRAPQALPGATRRRPQSGPQTTPAATAANNRWRPRQRRLLTFIRHPSSIILMALCAIIVTAANNRWRPRQRALAFNFHPSSFIHHPGDGAKRQHLANNRWRPRQRALDFNFHPSSNIHHPER